MLTLSEFSFKIFHENGHGGEKVSSKKPQKITYRDYKNFDSVKFNDELKYVLVKEKITSCTKFDEMFLRILNQHASLKSKLLRANHASNISKIAVDSTKKREKTFLTS